MEQRLIDATRLYAELLTYKDNKGCPRRIPDNDCDNFSNTIDVRTVRRAIVKSPTVEAVPVVRCKDCKHHRYYGTHWCNKLIMQCPNNAKFSCSYGAKMDGQEDGK